MCELRAGRTKRAPTVAPWACLRANLDSAEREQEYRFRDDQDWVQNRVRQRRGEVGVGCGWVWKMGEEKFWRADENEVEIVESSIAIRKIWVELRGGRGRAGSTCTKLLELQLAAGNDGDWTGWAAIGATSCEDHHK
jgi:hypothetical protein